MPRILITGGSGLIGTQLTKKLICKGYEVAILSRSTKDKNEVKTYFWNVEKNEIEKGALESADYIIHLAGTNIGDGRWTENRKNEIINSRVKSLQFISEKLKVCKKQPIAFISASAIGYYGAITSDKIFNEEDSPNLDFLSDVCQQWEKNTESFSKSGIRTVIFRTGVVLSKQGGILARMLAPIKLGLGSTIGSGKQFIPWIHIDDLSEIYIKAIEDSEMNGVYNAVAPEHKTNNDFTKALAFVLNKPLWLPSIPSIFLKLIFGKKSELLLYGSRVSSEKLIAAGYNFKYPKLEAALKNLLVPISN